MKKNNADGQKTGHDSTSNKTGFEGVFGFRVSDLGSWDSFVRLMNRPTHPASLAVFRVCYGLLMIIDCIDERGLGHALHRWGDAEECRFPLIHGLRPLAAHWMIVLHALMILGALGIMLGFMFRQSCILFVVPYWYMFILEKIRWNNHSYLFGLISIIMLMSDANRCWSLDGLIWPNERHTHVPLWNLAIPRFQLFILYFIAGLKKFDADWTHGYSMHLSNKLVFAPLRLFLAAETIDLFFVHTCGHMIDLFLVYLLFFDQTRIIGIIIGCLFNLMNASMFSIGMFSYMCVCTLPLYCYPDWPMRWMRKLPSRLQKFTILDEEPQPSEHCVYTKEAIDAARHAKQVTHSKQIKKDKGENKACTSTKNMKHHISWYHTLCTALALCYASEQLFLPYSHFITRGYNGWTNGLYGYSWDMMIHSWNVQFIKISFVEKDTGKVGYLRPEAFISRKNRWSSNADMIKQYAECIEERLAARNKTNVEIYIDVWKSLNKRFQQRMIDPRVNILHADWHPFKTTPWLMPLLVELSDWRDILHSVRKDTIDATNYTNIVFIADFPGLHLSNYLQTEISHVNLTVLKGEVIVEVEYNDTFVNTTVHQNETIDLPLGYYHNVHTVSSTPSCYYYTYEDNISKEMLTNATNIVNRLKEEQNVTENELLNITVTPEDDNTTQRIKEALLKSRQKKQRSIMHQLSLSIYEKLYRLERAYHSLWYAYRVIVDGVDPDTLMEQLMSVKNNEKQTLADQGKEQDTDLAIDQAIDDDMDPDPE